MPQLTVIDGYDRRKTPAQIKVRTMEPEEIRQLGTWGKDHVEFIANDGRLRQAKVTSVKTWKTRPNEVRVGLKYGLYEYASFETAECLSRLVVRITE